MDDEEGGRELGPWGPGGRRRRRARRACKGRREDKGADRSSRRNGSVNCLHSTCTDGGGFGFCLMNGPSGPAPRRRRVLVAGVRFAAYIGFGFGLEE
ncbi:hypothetical protein L226DRAFT_247987 [Lentinus tigrinus ALCF2SS1-7]|uniref:uncharacterized protein n=1 Tax=Lentinus tigrinus ALCF2SS1-7 TaxID=1328758 RepID=UPI0011663F65|nr:hypothetical protein L226DRAFT_247987 [Lentinus tigrinus ALCF2SS1-7]